MLGAVWLLSASWKWGVWWLGREWRMEDDVFFLLGNHIILRLWEPQAVAPGTLRYDPAAFHWEQLVCGWRAWDRTRQWRETEREREAYMFVFIWVCIGE